ncbi:hypothetical protein BV509_06790 [Rhodovulum sulfidophilum]|nr:hypothetical protein BV509_06790 [Rhodovulum sulfidophilum]
MPAFLYRIPFRIYLIVIVALALSIVLSVLLLTRAVSNAYQMRETELRGMTDAAISLLDDLQAKVEAGEMDRPAAEATGRRLLETLRFGESGYLFALDNNLVVTAHATLPEWVGTDKSDYADVKGLKLFQEMREVALRDGAGTVEYWFQKPGETEPEKKLGSVQQFKPWGWFVGTGAYVSDINAELASMRMASIITLIVGMLLLIAVSAVLVRSVTRPLAAFVESMRDVANGRYDTEIPASKRHDEIGDLGRNLSEFRDKLAESERLAAAREEDRREQERVVTDLGVGLRALSEGDLTRTIDTTFAPAYEQLRQDFNATVDTLNALMGEIVENSTEITTRAEEISGASDDLSRRTENQAATLEETAAAMDEMTASVRAAADGAAQVENVVREARGNAEQSGLVVKEAIGAMSEIDRDHLCRRKGTLVVVLAVYVEFCRCVVPAHVRLGLGQHPTGATRRVEHSDRVALLGQEVVVADEKQIDHEVNDFTRGEVVTGRLVGQFVEAPDQVLENEPHLVVRHLVRVQIDIAEFLHDQVKDVRVMHPFDFVAELEVLEDAANVG